jgi:ribosomal protein S27AE
MNTQIFHSQKGGMLQEEWRSSETIASSNMCGRCGGILVVENCLDVRDETGKMRFEAMRCVQCGDVLDPLIMKNRSRPIAKPIKKATSRRSWPRLQCLTRQAT